MSAERTLKRVLVTGAAGFIGSHVVDRLLSDGVEVIGVDSFVPYYPRELKEANISAVLANQAFTFHERDLRTDSIDDLLDGVDTVINEAATAGLDLSWVDVALYFSCNVLALDRLIKAISARRGIRLVHVSTSSVYGEHASGDEQLPTRPISPYGVSKLAAEHLLRAYARRADVDYVVLRYFSVYGPRQRPDMAYHRFIEAMLRQQPITVHGDGTQSRSNTYVADCVEATLRAARMAPSGEVYNVGGGQDLALRDAISLIATALAVEPQIHFVSPKPGDQLHTRADVSKAMSAFGYQPRVPADEGMHRQIEWHRSRTAAGGQGP